MRPALFIYGVLNVVLYAGLMPLWEGFDEPFHYGYIQHLWHARSLPITRQTTLSEEVWQSFPLAPASHVVQHNLPMVTTYEDYCRLTPAERLARRRQLEQIDPALGGAVSDALNYEAQQVPLAYAVLTPFDAILSRWPLLVRIFWIRVLCGLAAVLATGLLMLRMGTLLGFDRDRQFAAMFLALSSQMFYATTTHPANDWLAVPLFLLLLTSAVELYVRPGRGVLLTLGAALAAGLITKAYFLAMVPFAVVFVIPRCRRRDAILFTLTTLAIAAPFYVRNILLYGNIDGQQQNLGGTRFHAMFDAAFRLPWLRSVTSVARESLWVGNNSSTTFSTVTLSIMLLLLVAAAVFNLRRRPARAEVVLLVGMACFGAALTYNTVLEFYTTRGLTITTAPWYVELLWPPGLCLVMSRAPRVLRGVLCVLAAYIITATYVVKLIPLYSGYSGRPAHVLELARWYTAAFPQIREILSTTALIAPALIFLLTAAVTVAAFALAARFAGKDVG